jgi:nicotinate-nucleotide pyrophosphorylase (carboxylating)
MTTAQLREAVDLVQRRAITEASGGVTEATVAGIAQTGVDIVSVGWLTHSAPALDLTLEIF